MPGLVFHVDSDYQKVIKLREEIDKLKSTLSGMDGNTPPATLRAMEVQLSKNIKELDTMVSAAVKAGNELDQNFKDKIYQSSSALNDLTDKIINQKSVVRDVESDVKRLAATYANLGKFNTNSDQILSELTAAKKALDEEKATLFGLQQEQAKSRLSVKKLKDEYALYKKTAGDVVVSNKEMLNAIQSIPGPVGQVATSIKTLTKASLTFIATPIGAVLAAISAGLAALTSWFNRTEEGQNALNVASAYFKQTLDSVLDVVDDVGEWLYKAFTKPKEALTDLTDFLEGQVMNRLKAVGKMGESIWKIFSGDFSAGLSGLENAYLQGITGIEDAGSKLSSFMDETNKKAEQRMAIAEKQNALDVKERENLIERAKLEAKINELREKAYDESVSESERSKAIKEASKLTDEMFNKEIELAKERYEIIRDTNALSHSNKDAKQKEAQAEAELSRLEAQRSAAQRMLLRQSNRFNRSNSDNKELEKQKAIYKELLDLRLQNQQVEINLMKEGSEKKIAQINLDYDKEIAAILAKEKEWKDAQDGKLTKEQTVEIRTALVNSYVKKEKSTGLVSSEQLAEEKRMMNEYLKEYGSYMEKRQAVTELYNEKISKALTSGEKLSLGEEMKKALAAVDDEAQKKTSIITKLFSDMSKRTVADIRAIAKEAQEMLDYVNSGEFKTGSDGNGLFGLTKDQFDILSKSPEKLQAIKDEIANVNREADQCETAFNKMSGGLKKVFAAGDDARKLKEGLAEIEEGMNDIMQAGQFLSETFSKLGDAFGGAFSGIAEGLNVVMDTMSSAMNGAKAGAMFGQIGMAAGAAIGVVTSLAGAIAKIHDKKNEKRIERLQEQIDTLDKSYEKLGKEIDKAYSKDASKLIEQNNKRLEQQKVLIQQQIREEQDKKKTDKDRIKDWQNQIDEINQAIADNKEKAEDAIFGEDLKSAIENFANAQAEAWASGENRAESAKDTVKRMMRQMVTESIKAATDSSGAMEKIRQKLKEFYADNVFSDWEQDYIYNMAEELQKELDRQFGWADSLMKNKKEDTDVSDNSLKGAYSKASQESIDLLAGQTGAARVVLEDIRNSTQPIREQMKLIYDMQSKGWEDVHAIRDLSDKVEKNTEQIAENTREIKEVAGKISENTKRTFETLEGRIDVNIKGM
ncbi:phage tail tape measure protein [Parabacteroides sp. AM08-6]|uniref:phage tail tape measure protein n=1 Tax=Parabacteroides sp. AM08-6 TaxID=2292053 RepID=UPI001F2A76EC|nr:phage tail tape measure protein [Parabacteroides sp. AM08-6]